VWCAGARAASNTVSISRGRTETRYSRRVSLSQIEYFVAVAEEQHVGRAARKLHVAQPAVSRQIKNLEDELEVPLFRRTPRGMLLSPAGTIFLDHARTILRGVHDAKAAVRVAIRT
jgi:DNA-binding transcriptional LysR family regulator